MSRTPRWRFQSDASDACTMADIHTPWLEFHAGVFWPLCIRVNARKYIFIHTCIHVYIYMDTPHVHAHMHKCDATKNIQPAWHMIHVPCTSRNSRGLVSCFVCALRIALRLCQHCFFLRTFCKTCDPLCTTCCSTLPARCLHSSPRHKKIMHVHACTAAVALTMACLVIQTRAYFCTHTQQIHTARAEHVSNNMFKKNVPNSVPGMYTHTHSSTA
jgi:hypothetical protein